MNEIDLRVRVLLSLQRALLGAIVPSIRGITCSYDDSEIKILCLFDGEYSDDDKEILECVSTEVVADFPSHQIILDCIRHDNPELINPKVLSDWVYLRKEDD